jgi:hypothetical protein
MSQKYRSGKVETGKMALTDSRSERGEAERNQTGTRATAAHKGLWILYMGRYSWFSMDFVSRVVFRSTKTLVDTILVY